MTEITNHAEATLSSVVDSTAAGLCEHATVGAADTSMALSDTTENDSILSQFLADTGTNATDIDCTNIEEIDPDKFMDTDLSVALEVADAEDGSEHTETGFPEEQHPVTLLSTLNDTVVDNGEAANSQQSESLVDLYAEDVIAVVSNDISESTGMVLDDAVAYKCTENSSGPVELSESQIFQSSLHGATIITASMSESFSKQQLQRDLTDVINAERSACMSVTDGRNTCLVGSDVNSAELVDDVHSSSSLIQCTSEADDVGTQLLPEDGNESDASVAYGIRRASSTEGRNIVGTFVNPDNIKRDVLLESSTVTDSQVDTAQKSGSPSCSSALVEHVDDVLSSSSLDHHSSEAENVSIHLLPEGNHLVNPGNETNALHAGIMKGTLSEEDHISVENGSILPTNDVPNDMEQDGDLSESSPVTDTRIDIAKKSGSSELVEHVDDGLSLNHHSSEMENVNIRLLSDYDNLLKPDNDSGPPIPRSMKGILFDEDRSILPTTDAPGNMEHDDIVLESSSVTDLHVDTAKSEHVDDIDSCSSLVNHSCDVENTDRDMLPKHDLLKPDKDLEVSLTCSMEEMLFKEDCNIPPTSDVPDNKEQDDSLVELSSITGHRVDSTKSDRPSHTCQLEEHVQCDMCESAVESAQLLPCTGEHLNAASVVSDTVDPCESAAVSDQTLDLTCEEIPEEIPAYALEISTTETDGVNRKDENNDAKSSHISEMEVVYINSGDVYKDVILSSASEVMSVPVEGCSSSVVLISNTGLPESTATSRDTKTVDVDSETDKSTVIVLKNALASTQPSTTSIPSSTSAVLSNILNCITSTAANSASSSIGSTVQLLENCVVASAVESKSTSTVYRPAAALAMSVGKNLVTESILHEVVAKVHKWMDHTDEEKVPVSKL